MYALYVYVRFNLESILMLGIVYVFLRLSNIFEDLRRKYEIKK